MECVEKLTAFILKVVAGIAFLDIDPTHFTIKDFCCNFLSLTTHFQVVSSPGGHSENNTVRLRLVQVHFEILLLEATRRY